MYIMYNTDLLRNDLLLFLKKHGMSYRKFAELSNINVSIISRIMNGDYMPGKSIVDRIVGAIDGNILTYTITSDKKAYYIDKLDIDKMSIDELDDLMNYIKKVKREKIETKLQEISSESKKLYEQRNMYEQLLKEET